MIPATPKYSIDQRVQYRDREGRIQEGVVKWIEAKWYGRGHRAVVPLIIYALHHPTYRNNNYYGTDEDILRALFPLCSEDTKS